MKPTDQIYRISDNNIGVITEDTGMDTLRVQWNDGTFSTENSWDIKPTPAQEFNNMPSELWFKLMTIKCWLIIFWMGIMESDKQKWINRSLVIVIGYFILQLILGLTK